MPEEPASTPPEPGETNSPDEGLTLANSDPNSQNTSVDTSVIENPWQSLRRFTPARIALGRTGHSLPTHELLNFQLAHAQARDAVYSAFDPARIAGQLAERGYSSLQVHSQATDRTAFLKRPDLGRRLNPSSRDTLLEYAAQSHPTPDLLFVLGDGLSAEAIHRHAVPVLDLTAQALRAEGWQIGPVVIASQSRVALGDEIGQLLKAGQVAILIGERPGLSTADSLGIYLTYQPHVGRLESERNCISNVRPEGLSYEAASSTLLDLVKRAKLFHYSGVKLTEL